MERRDGGGKRAAATKRSATGEMRAAAAEETAGGLSRAVIGDMIKRSATRKGGSAAAENSPVAQHQRDKRSAESGQQGPANMVNERALARKNLPQLGAWQQMERRAGDGKREAAATRGATGEMRAAAAAESIAASLKGKQPSG